MRVLIAYDCDEYEEILKHEASGEVISVEDSEMPENLPEELQECVEALEAVGYWKTLWSLNKFLKTQSPVRIAYMVKIYMQYKDIEAAMKTARQVTFAFVSSSVFEHEGLTYTVTPLPNDRTATLLQHTIR
jgi:hypothetical protein